MKYIMGILLLVPCLLCSTPAHSQPDKEMLKDLCLMALRMKPTDSELAQFLGYLHEAYGEGTSPIDNLINFKCPGNSLLEKGKTEEKTLLQILIDAKGRFSHFPTKQFVYYSEGQQKASLGLINFLKELKKIADNQGRPSQAADYLSLRFPNGYTPIEYINKLIQKSNLWSHIQQLLIMRNNIESLIKASLKKDNKHPAGQVSLDDELSAGLTYAGWQKYLKKYPDSKALLAAAQNGDQTAAYLIAKLHLANFNSPIAPWVKMKNIVPSYSPIAQDFSIRKAYNWYLKCTDIPSAYSNIASLMRYTKDKIKWYELASEKGDIYAKTILCRAYLGLPVQRISINDPVKPNKTRGMKLLLELDSEADEDLSLILGNHYFEKGDKKSLTKALDYYSKSNSILSHYRRAVIHDKLGNAEQAVIEYITVIRMGSYDDGSVQSVAGLMENSAKKLELYTDKHRFAYYWMAENALNDFSKFNNRLETYFATAVLAKYLIHGGNFSEPSFKIYDHEFGIYVSFFYYIYRYYGWSACRNGFVSNPDNCNKCSWKFPGYLTGVFKWRASPQGWEVSTDEFPRSFTVDKQVIIAQLLSRVIERGIIISYYHKYAWQKMKKMAEDGNIYAKYNMFIFENIYNPDTRKARNKCLADTQKMLLEAPRLPWETLH